MSLFNNLSKAIGSGFTDPVLAQAYTDIFNYTGQLEEIISRQFERISVLEEYLKEVQEEHSYLKDKLKSKQGVPYYENIKPVVVR